MSVPVGCVLSKTEPRPLEIDTRQAAESALARALRLYHAAMALWNGGSGPVPEEVAVCSERGGAYVGRTGSERLHRRSPLGTNPGAGFQNVAVSGENRMSQNRLTGITPCITLGRHGNTRTAELSSIQRGAGVTPRSGQGFTIASCNDRCAWGRQRS